MEPPDVKVRSASPALGEGDDATVSVDCIKSSWAGVSGGMTSTRRRCHADSCPALPGSAHPFEDASWLMRAGELIANPVCISGYGGQSDGVIVVGENGESRENWISRTAGPGHILSVRIPGPGNVRSARPARHVRESGRSGWLQVEGQRKDLLHYSRS